MRILLTGATGFVGRGIVKRLMTNTGYILRLAARKPNAIHDSDQNLSWVAGDLTPEFNWQSAVSECEVVIHAAARVHVLNDTSSDPLAEFRRVNVKGTLNLARQAALAGVRRFIFISSIKVNGESTSLDKPFIAEDMPAPLDPYGVSKLEAEQGLREIAFQTGMEIVIIRPPLVYGPGVKANFLSMMRWVYRGIPLPLGAIYNRRSLVVVDNLVDIIATCIKHPAAANQIFLVSDGKDISTTQLLKRMGDALGKPVRLMPVPMEWLKWSAACVGKTDVAQRLCGSLHLDISKTQQLLEWAPPTSMDDGLKQTAEYWLASYRMARN